MKKTETELKYVCHVICEELDRHYKSSWFKEIELDVFGEERSCIRCNDLGTIHLSYPQYKIGAERSAITEYLDVVDAIKLPHFRDSELRCCILTDEPEVFLILHEISHIIVEKRGILEGLVYPEHGEEFCYWYFSLIQMIQPDMIFPF